MTQDTPTYVDYVAPENQPVWIKLASTIVFIPVLLVLIGAVFLGVVSVFLSLYSDEVVKGFLFSLPFVFEYLLK